MLCFPLSFKKQDRKCIKADRIIRDFINAASCGTEKGKERGTGPNYVLEQTHAADAKPRSANWRACTQKNKVSQDLVCCENQGKSFKKSLRTVPEGRW